MKICHVITRMIHGGAQENTLLTLQGLKELTDWEIHLACGSEIGREGNLLPEVEALGIPCHVLPGLKRDLNLREDFVAYHQLHQLFLRQAFDLVHTHSSKAGILGRMAARQARTLCIIHTIHGLAFDDYQTWWRNVIYRFAERAAAENADRIVTVCNHMRDCALAAGVGEPSQYRTIYSGFPLEGFFSVRPRTPAPGRFVLGMIARMFPMKGHEEMMKMASTILERWPDLDLRIVGDGPLRPDWGKWLGKHQVWRRRIEFTGRVPAGNIPAQLAQMDGVIHLSLREGLPRVVPQALAAGRPVCVYNVGGVAEVVEHGKTGWLVEPGDTESLLKALSRMKENVPLFDAEYARHRVQKLFDYRHMQQQIVRLYEESLRPQKTVPLRFAHHPARSRA